MRKQMHGDRFILGMRKIIMIIICLLMLQLL